MAVERDGAVLHIALNRPDARNAIDETLAAQVVAALAALDADPALRVGVITGRGRGFCAGMDLKAFVSDGAPQSAKQLFEIGSRKPLVAGVEGFALAGGLELALICDLIVAGRSSRFGIPEAAIGLLAAGGALVRLPSRIGYSRAAQMALTGRPIGAGLALEWGLVQEVVDDGAAARSAIDLARQIAANAPLSLGATKAVLQGSLGMTEAAAFEGQRQRVAEVFASADAREGATAFAERRAAVWTGV